MYNMASGTNLRLGVALVLLSVVLGNLWHSQIRDNDMGDYHVVEGQVFLEANKAKAVLKRVKRGWWIGENSEEREETRENNNAINQHRTCSATCWGSWSSWSSCSNRCGNNGIKRASRARRPTSACQAWVNSNGCPGQSAKTYPCSRNSCKNNGTPIPNRCRCPTGFTGTCCETRITCSNPGRPTNGKASPFSSSHAYNTVVRFTCNTGYSLSGLSAIRCLANRKWSGSIPRCNIISCGAPDQPANGVRVGSSYVYGKTVTYRCNTGYKLSSNTPRTCQANKKWSGSTPTCNVVVCPALSAPSGGQLSAPSRNYRAVAKITCNPGYYIQGSAQRTCQSNGQWSGSVARCLRIVCPNLTAPSGGKVAFPSGSNRYYGHKAVYSCNSGYTLTGGSTRTCGGTGRQGTWSGSAPRCNAVSCGDPGAPSHGVRVGSSFIFPSKVSFRCVPGYVIRGTASVSCLATSKWSAAKPTCVACPKNQYKIGSNSRTSCSACPAHSHTVGLGNGDVKMCLCDSGYRGAPGGPCTEVRCPALQPPSNGKISGCHTTVEGACTFDCNDGYIRGSGDSVRTCKQDGTWSGVSLVCQACPKDTYKGSSTQCQNCPSNSQTVGTGSVKRDCTCKTGYLGPQGGPCSDLNECSQSNGGCEQRCVNSAGSYKCQCHIPGYIVDPISDKQCKEDRICSEFPKPENGGAVCNRIFVTNTKRCQVRCNLGYDHLDKPNPFELCGPDTNWRWSYQVDNRDIPGCIEEFFQGVRTEADIFYFDDLCKSLTAAQKMQIRQQFIQMLRQQGVCRQGTNDVCHIDNVRINCGEASDFDLDFGFKRRKRSTGSFSGKLVLDIKFDIKVAEKAVKDANCARFCGNVELNSESCKKICKEKYTAEALSNIRKASQALKDLFQSNVKIATPTTPTFVERHRPTGGTGWSAKRATVRRITRPPRTEVEAPPALVITIGGRSLFPASKKVKVEEKLQQNCGSGTISKNGTCVACAAGSVPSSNKTSCDKCPVGYHQPRPKMTSCIRCTSGTTSTTTGATRCN